MKISIITATYNSAETLMPAIQSVLDQDYPDLEYIVVDGGSTDGTLDMIRKVESRIARFVSEPDKGIYDALNKGIKLASGDVVGFLHSDDFFANNSVVSAIAEAFLSPELQALYTDLHYVDRQNPERVVRRWLSGSFKRQRFYYGWMPPHPTFYLRRMAYSQHGLYRTDMRISADYELMLRMLLALNLKAEYLPIVSVKMRVGGISNASWRRRWQANVEDRKAWEVNGLQPYWFTRWLKPLSKLGQYLPF